MAAADGFQSTAGSLDLMLAMASNKGCTAFVTDDLVRDIEGITNAGIPCFARGVTPNSPVRNGPGAVGQSIVLDGVQVNSGDIIIGDINGVVVVRLLIIDKVLELLVSIKSAEAAMDDKVKGGLSRPPFVDY